MPPAWAERLLRALLAQRSRDVIVGDLLEEYRESVLPALGTFRADIRYIRQVLSFVNVAGLLEIAGKISAPLVWGPSVALLGYVLVFEMSYATGMAVTTVIFLFTGIALIICGATAIRTLVEGWSLLRTGSAAFICFGVVTVVMSRAQAFRPSLIIGMFLIIVTATGFRGAWRSGQIRSGIVAAVFTGIAASVLLVVTVSASHRPHPPLSAASILPGMAAISGTIGALFGKRFGCSPQTAVWPPSTASSAP
jgi:hypothetical protein